jgi:hypothetical protein
LLTTPSGRSQSVRSQNNNKHREKQASKQIKNNSIHIYLCGNLTAERPLIIIIIIIIIRVDTKTLVV